MRVEFEYHLHTHLPTYFRFCCPLPLSGVEFMSWFLWHHTGNVPLIDLFSALGLRVTCLEIWNAHLSLVLRLDEIFGASLQIVTNEQLRLKLFPLFFFIEAGMRKAPLMYCFCSSSARFRDDVPGLRQGARVLRTYRVALFSIRRCPNAEEIT